jgi:hypothetical protein
MDFYEIPIPSSLNLAESIRFAALLRNSPPAEVYTFNFGNLRWIEPFALLFLSSEIQRMHSKNPESKFVAINPDSCSYAAHMGFFQSFGLNYGKHPGEASGSSTYLPITICDVKKLSDSPEPDVYGPVIDHWSNQMTSMLTRTESGDLYKTIAYSIQEMLRNIIEHSRSSQYGYCAQYWPYHQKVEVAILDRGIGIRDGLLNNPDLSILDDRAALTLALMPGVSGKKDPQRLKGFYSNMGLGLYMVSRLCREGGDFFIASGEKGLFLSENNPKVFLDVPFSGTAVRLTLNTSRLQALGTRLEQYHKEAENVPYPIDAACASMMLTRDFKIT